MSSHWQDFSGRFRVALTSDGHLEAVGYGFGDCRWRSTPHRIFDTITRWSHLRHLTNRNQAREMYETLKPLVRRMQLDPTFDVFRQGCTAAFLAEHVEGFGNLKRILLIGDGYGVLGALLKTLCPGAQIVFIDLGQTLLFQSHHVALAHPERTHALAGAADLPWPQLDFVYWPADQTGPRPDVIFDLAINVASMQEMASHVVASYFDLLRANLGGRRTFYCCNRERKVMPGGEVSELANYPWRADDDIVIDELCPWHQYYVSPVGRAMWRGLPVPFLQYYDGPHRHRLVNMS